MTEVEVEQATRKSREGTSGVPDVDARKGAQGKMKKLERDVPTITVMIMMTMTTKAVWCGAFPS